MSTPVSTTHHAVSLVLAACLTLMLSFFGYRLLERSSQQRFGTVDISGIVAKQQEASIRALASQDTDASSKAAALESAAQFGKKLDEALIVVATQCRCVLLVKESVVVSNLPDFTSALMTKLETK